MDIDPGFALFSLPGWRREKLQVLRWIAHDQPAASAPVLGALERALADADWELRVTAMLAAARLRATGLAAKIARTPLPQSQRQGLSDEELRFVDALRDATLAALGARMERTLPAGVADALDGNDAALPPALACCLHALTQPLPDEVPAPPPAAAIVLADTGPQLADGTLLAWVPPLPHWLGAATLRHVLPNPVRRQAPAAGFFVDAELRGVGTLAQALAVAGGEAQRLGRAVSLPGRDAWEMAARGPDGRRFPWGMNAEPQAWSDLSPWGVAGISRGDGEWLDVPRDAEGAGVVAGGRREPAPARHSLAAAGTLHGYRFLYP